MKIAAVVILYEPEENVISNIKSYYNFVDKIYVIDNSEKNTSLNDEFIKLSKIEFFHEQENLGIAARLNFACHLALAENFDWILTMDQDTSFTDDAISAYISCFQKFPGKEKVAALGTTNSNELSHKPADCESADIQELITSGMLVNLSVFDKLGGFDEALFIDYVDNEYCARCLMAGYRIIRFENICILHHIGKEVYRASIKSLYLKRKNKAIHSPLRCYYMYRNMLYLEKKYKATNKQFVDKTKSNIMARIKVCILYGGEMLKTIGHIILAKYDFKNNRMGKFDHKVHDQPLWMVVKASLKK